MSVSFVTPIEIGVFASVFAAICLAYRLGGRWVERPAAHQILQQYSPPIPMFLEYRNGTGLVTSRPIRVHRVLRNRDGCLYLFGFCGEPGKPRTFRVDRIQYVTTGEGEIVEISEFLVGHLGIAPDIVTSQRAVRGNGKMTSQTVSQPRVNASHRR